MTITELKEIAGIYVKEHSGSTPHTFLNKIRKNLIVLLCQSDVIELTGTIDSFGGKEEAGSSISKSIFNLLCLASLLGADVDATINQMGEEVKKTLASAPPEKETAADPVPGANQHTEPQDDSNGDNKKLELYHNALNDCKAKTELKKVWKGIIEDKELDNKDKFSLQKKMKDLEKRLN